jgi:hypothetical protein
MCNNTDFYLNYLKRCIKYQAEVMKNLYKATRFYYDTHGCTFYSVYFGERLAGQAVGLCGIAGRAFSSHLPCKMR